MPKEPDELIVLGKVSGFYGVKGWLKLFSHTDPKENIVRYASLKINLGQQWQTIHLDAGKAHGKGVVAHFSGYDSREAAAALIGSELAVYRSDFKTLAKEEYFWADLIGLKVTNLQGIVLGSVVRLMETSANDVLVIKAHVETGEKAQDEILIPFVLQRYIEAVDKNEGVILVNWPVEWNE